MNATLLRSAINALDLARATVAQVPALFDGSLELQADVEAFLHDEAELPAHVVGALTTWFVLNHRRDLALRLKALEDYFGLLDPILPPARRQLARGDC